MEQGEENVSKERLFTVRQVSEILDVDEEELLEWRKIGIGPQWVEVEDGAIRYPLSGLRAFIKRVLGEK